MVSRNQGQRAAASNLSTLLVNHARHDLGDLCRDLKLTALVVEVVSWFSCLISLSSSALAIVRRAYGVL